MNAAVTIREGVQDSFKDGANRAFKNANEQHIFHMEQKLRRMRMRRASARNIKRLEDELKRMRGYSAGHTEFRRPNFRPRGGGGGGGSAYTGFHGFSQEWERNVNDMFAQWEREGVQRAAKRAAAQKRAQKDALVGLGVGLGVAGGYLAYQHHRNKSRPWVQYKRNGKTFTRRAPKRKPSTRRKNVR